MSCDIRTTDRRLWVATTSSVVSSSTRRRFGFVVESRLWIVFNGFQRSPRVGRWKRVFVAIHSAEPASMFFDNRRLAGCSTQRRDALSVVIAMPVSRVPRGSRSCPCSLPLFNGCAGGTHLFSCSGRTMLLRRASERDGCPLIAVVSCSGVATSLEVSLFYSGSVVVPAVLAALPRCFS